MEPNQPSPAPYSPPTSPAPMMPPPAASGIGAGKIIAGLAVLAVVAVGAYYLGGSGDEVAVSPTPSASSLPTATPTPDATADWKTYSSVDGGYKYEFRYPSSWPTPKPFSEQVYSGVSLGPISVGGCEGSDCYTTSFSTNTAPVSVFGKDAPETPERVLADIKTDGGGTLISDETRDDGSRVIVYRGGGMFSVVIVDIFYPSVERKFHARFTQRTESSQQLETILSTFKFTSPTSTVPADWKSFSSKYFTLSFKVPPGFSVHEEQNLIAISEGEYTVEGKFMTLLRYTGNFSKTQASESFRQETINFQESTITIDGISFPRLSGTHSVNNFSYGQWSRILFDSSTLLIEENGDGRSAAHMPLADQILSTFRFSR